MPSLDDVYDAIKADPFWDYLRLPGIEFVPGYGQRTRPKVLIVGEAPGAVENKRLRPFCGPSGRVLDHLMAQAGLWLDKPVCQNGDGCKVHPIGHLAHTFGDGANAFVTNVVKYRPPHNATPNLAAINHAVMGFKQKSGPIGDRHIDESLPEGAGSLRDEWRALGGPRVIVCVGGVAHAALHPMGYDSVSNWAGRPFSAPGQATWFFSQFHPAYGLRKGQKTQEKMSRDWTAMGEFLRQEGLL